MLFRSTSSSTPTLNLERSKIVSEEKPPRRLEWLDHQYAVEQCPAFPYAEPPVPGTTEETVVETIGSKSKNVSDELVFDDDVPVVIQGRHRLVRTLSLHFGGEAELYDLGGTRGPCWMAFIHGQVGEIIPVPLSEVPNYLSSLRSVYQILEAIYDKGVSLDYIISSSEISVSVPVKGSVAPR